MRSRTASVKRRGQYVVQHACGNNWALLDSMKVTGVPQDPVSCARAHPHREDAAMVALLADMALNTWKEASSW
jgi:hypothetical protein